MEEDALEGKKQASHFRRMIITGVLTLIPLWITWFVMKLLFVTLSEIGSPVVRAASHWIRDFAPILSTWLLSPWVEDLFSVFLSLLALYFLGLLATVVVGKQVIRAIEELISKIPFVQTLYGASKKLIQSLQSDPEKLQRVVMISFPHEGMKALGFVTASLKDKDNGQELAAVYVPTTPNPTSGYLEIIPSDQLVPTDMSIEEAMTFIISGGTISPENIAYTLSNPASPGMGEPKPDKPESDNAETLSSSPKK